jgi:uncharacterized phiE125 gp8 family phage protein
MPVTVGEAKDWSRILHDEEDGIVQSNIETAVGYLDGRDGILGRCLMGQTWDYTLPCFPVESWIELPFAPVQSITSITYKDGDGNPQTTPGAEYVLSADRDWQPKVHLAYGASWPAVRDEPDVVRVRAVYGYTAVPLPIRQAIVLLAGHLFENREATTEARITEIPFGVSALLEPYMRISFA